MPRPKFAPVLIRQFEPTGTEITHGEPMPGLKTYAVPIDLFHKVPAHCAALRASGQKDSSHLSEEKVFALYHGLRKRKTIAEQTGQHREYCSNPSARGYFFFSAEQAYMERYGGKHYQIHRQVLIDLGAIKWIPAHEDPPGNWTRQEVSILPNSSGLIQFQCPKSNYGKKENGYSPNCPNLDPLFFKKYTYHQSITIDPAFADFIAAMKRRYPEKVDAIDDQVSLISSIIEGDPTYSISEKNGRHTHIVAALKRELRFYLKDRDGNRFQSLDIKSTIARLLYVLLRAYLSEPMAQTSEEFRGYNPELRLGARVDSASLYSSLKLTPVFSEASKKLSEILAPENRDRLTLELPRFLATIEGGFYEAGIRWIVRDFPNIPPPSRDDVKSAVMPFIYGEALDTYPVPTVKDVAEYGYGYLLGASFEKEFPAIGQAIRALKAGPTQDAYCDVSRFIFSIESHLVQTLMAKDIFNQVEGVIIVHDCIYFIPRYRNKVWSIMTEYMRALGFEGKSLSEGDTKAPTDWVSKKKRRKWVTEVSPVDGTKIGRKRLPGIHARKMKRLRTAWANGPSGSKA